MLIALMPLSSQNSKCGLSHKTQHTRLPPTKNFLRRWWKDTAGEFAWWLNNTGIWRGTIDSWKDSSSDHQPADSGLLSLWQYQPNIDSTSAVIRLILIQKDWYFVSVYSPMNCVYIFCLGIEKMYLKHKLLKMSEPLLRWLSLLFYL